MGRVKKMGQVPFSDPATGAELGQVEVKSKNLTAVDSANMLVRDHADDIADFVLAASR